MRFHCTIIQQTVMINKAVTHACKLRKIGSSRTNWVKKGEKLQETKIGEKKSKLDSFIFEYLIRAFTHVQPGLC